MEENIMVKCKECGYLNGDNASKCVNCGYDISQRENLLLKNRSGDENGYRLKRKIKKLNKIVVIEFAIAIILIATLVYVGVSSKKWKKDLLNQYDKIQEQYENSKKEYNDLNSAYVQLTNKYDEYRERMKEYEELSELEAQSRKIEAQKIIDEKRAEEERIAKEAKEEAEKKEKAGYNTGISYEQLARTPDKFKGEKVKFSGEVVQIIESSGSNYIHIRFAVNGDYNDMLFCEYEKDIVQQRVLENDTITIYGVSHGLYTYQSTMGTDITIPSVIIDKIDQ